MLNFGELRYLSLIQENPKTELFELFFLHPRKLIELLDALDQKKNTTSIYEINTAIAESEIGKFETLTCKLLGMFLFENSSKAIDMPAVGARD